MDADVTISDFFFYNVQSVNGFRPDSLYMYVAKMERLEDLNILVVCLTWFGDLTLFSGSKASKTKNEKKNNNKNLQRFYIQEHYLMPRFELTSIDCFCQ